MAPKRPSSARPPSSDVSSSDREHAEEEANPSSASPRKSSPPKNPTNGPPKPTDPTNVEEEENGADDRSGSDAEETDKNPPPQPPPPPNGQKSALKTSEPGSTDEDGGENEESDDDEELPLPQRPSRGTDPSIKPINSRPMDGPPAPKKTVGASEPWSKKRRASMRPSSEPKRQHFQRLWGLEDEMTILRGLVRYHARKGALPASTLDMERFHKLIRSSLSVEVTISQLSDKVRRLRKKFADASARGKKGADPAFPSDHERDMFELSKRVWGSKNAAAESDEEVGSDESDCDVGRSQNAKESNYASPIQAPKNRKSSAPRSIAMANGNLGSDDKKVSYPYLFEVVDELAKEHPSGAVFKRAFAMLDDTKVKAMEEKIRKHRLAEIRHNVHRMDLMKATVKLVLDALEASEQ